MLLNLGNVKDFLYDIPDKSQYIYHYKKQSILSFFTILVFCGIFVVKFAFEKIKTLSLSHLYNPNTIFLVVFTTKL